MPLDQLLLTVLGVAIVVNIVLVVASVFALRPGGIRPPRRPGDAAGGQAVTAGARGPTVTAGARNPDAAKDEPIRASTTPLRPADREDDGRVAAAVEAFVAGVAIEASDSPRLPTPAEVFARRRELLEGERTTTGAAEPHFLSAASSRATGSEPIQLAGVADATTWERMVRDESARVARFRRPSSVVTASLRHLDDLTGWGGRDTADRVVAQAAMLLESECRSIDRVARLGDARFGILLPETSELGASQFADRVRAAADAWFTSAGLTVRLEFAWSSVPGGGEAEARHPVASQSR